MADSSRDLQDEYCEWSVTRDPAGKISRVTFTSEGPEYWNFLAATDQATTLALYKRFVDTAVTVGDLYPDGRTYSPRNRFNSTTSGGAMHLVQPNNTLGAEINIVARSTLLRQIGGRLLTGEQELIECGGYGEKTRNSDPHIGGEVNSLARAGALVTIANPVALYIADLFTTSDWRTPDGSDPKDYWKIVRGTPELALRAVYEVPAAKGFTVGDIEIGGPRIQFGAPIADFIKIKVVGLACKFGSAGQAPRTTCPTDRFSPASAGVLEILRDTPMFKKSRR